MQIVSVVIFTAFQVSLSFASVCDDQDRHCPIWSRQFGCQDSFIAEKCKNTCKLCKEETSWSKCTKSCGGGIQHTLQNTTCVASALNGCKNSTRTCNMEPCRKDQGVSWSGCTKTCGGGTQYSLKKPGCAESLQSGYKCGKIYRICNAEQCHFSEELKWSNCSAKCGYGTQFTFEDHTCDESVKDIKKCPKTYRKCFIKPCPKLEWSKCSRTCGLGVQYVFKDSTCAKSNTSANNCHKTSRPCNIKACKKEKVTKLEELEPSKTHTCNEVTSVPPNVLGHRPYSSINTTFYKKYTSAYGIPIISSGDVKSRALQRACYVVRFLLADRDDIRKQMFYNGARLTVIGQFEKRVPEMGRQRWPRGRSIFPVSIAPEENLLCSFGDRYGNIDVMLHEVVHTIQIIAEILSIPDFSVRRAYDNAMSKGLYKGMYARRNMDEYFAEGVRYHFQNLTIGRKNTPSRKIRIETYDPALGNLIKQIFPCDNTYIEKCLDLSQERSLSQELRMDCNKGRSL